MLGLASVALVALVQDPTSPAGGVRIAIEADGRPVILRHDGRPPEPLFGSLVGEGASVFATLQNHGLAGNLGLFLGAPRPLSTMLDPSRYCEQAGLRRTTAALCELLEALPADATAAQRQRRSLDRLVALTLLARDGEPAAREAIARAAAGEDRLEAAWAAQLLGARDGKAEALVGPIEPLANALAAVPSEAQAIVLVEHAHAPAWRDLWRVMNELGRAVTHEAIARGGGTATAADLTEAELMLERSHLLGFELARRLGNACLARTLVAAPAMFATGSSKTWVRFAGRFDPERIATGLRAEDVDVTATDETVHAVLPGPTEVRASAATVTLSSMPEGEALGAERGRELAAALDRPNLLVALVLLDPAGTGLAPLPAPAQPLLADLRSLCLRHAAGEGAHLWLELRYGEAKLAAAAASALGALHAAARASAAEAPRAVRELLPEIRIARDGTLVTAEVELEETLGPWLEKLLPELAPR